jgi:hypothetical protein
LLYSMYMCTVLTVCKKYLLVNNLKLIVGFMLKNVITQR